MPNTFDGGGSTPRDLFGSLAGIDFPDDLNQPVFPRFDEAVPVEDATDRRRVTLDIPSSAFGGQPWRLEAEGRFPPLPADPADRAQWLEAVQTVTVRAVTLANPDGQVIDIAFDSPRPLAVFAGPAADLMAEADEMQGTPWADALGGGDGDDLIVTGGGNDFADGGAGDDVLRTGAGRDNGSGGAGDDRIDLGADNDFGSGGGGNDTVLGGGGDDYLQGSVEATGERTVLNGAKGDDTLQGEAGLLFEAIRDFVARSADGAARAAASTEADDAAPSLVGEIVARGGKGIDTFFSWLGSVGHGPETREQVAIATGLDLRASAGGLDQVQVRNSVLGGGPDQDTDGFFDQIQKEQRDLDTVETLMAWEELRTESVARTTVTTQLKDVEHVEVNAQPTDYLIAQMPNLASAMRYVPDDGADARGGLIIIDFEASEPSGQPSTLEIREVDGLRNLVCNFPAPAVGDFSLFDVDLGLGLSDGDDGVLGGPGNDTILGNGGNDTIDGGQGDDILDGGRGRDTYRGGPGADIFVLGNDGRRDVVQGFDPANDQIAFRSVIDIDLVDVRDRGGRRGVDLIYEGETTRFRGDLDPEDFPARVFIEQSDFL